MSIKGNYLKFRQHSPSMTVGNNAKDAIKSARILKQWDELLYEDPDPSFYDTY
jgi:hypothetical protein